ncbi:hypothetical protein ABE437_11080 [Isoptericola cucumis]|uniref:type IV toxin-antitoxin system AbiEi family antitoxin domain-containing protein n=1 Tax=Isoptericola cucumis TaxID=1776856 RepID=UPI00320913EF
MTEENRIVTTRDLPRRMRTDAVRAGRLERVRRGVYRAVEDDRDEHASTAARRLAADRARAVHLGLAAAHSFSHETAALFHGLRLWSLPRTTHVVQAYRRSGAAAGDVRRHRVALPDGHRTTAGGLPVTSLARTVVDCSRAMHPLESLVIADHAVAKGVDLAECAEILAATRQRNGTALARWVLEHADGGADSAWETWLRYVALRAGLPRPVTQAPLPTAGRVYHADLGWPEWGVYAEFDGRSKYRDDGIRPGHDASDELFREKQRFDAIRATGVSPVRVTATGGAGVRRVTDLLAARFPEPVRRGFRVHRLLPPPP